MNYYERRRATWGILYVVAATLILFGYLLGGSLDRDVDQMREHNRATEAAIDELFDNTDPMARRPELGAIRY